MSAKLIAGVLHVQVMCRKCKELVWTKSKGSGDRRKIYTCLSCADYPPSNEARPRKPK